MYGIRLNPEARQAPRGATAQESQAEAGCTKYPGHKPVLENMTFTEYNNNNVFGDSSLLSERMLPNGNVLSRSSYSHSTSTSTSTMLSNTRVIQSEFIGSSTVKKETLSGSSYKRTLESRRIKGHSRYSGSTPSVHVVEVLGGAVCHLAPLQEEETEFCRGKSAKPPGISFKCLPAACGAG